MNVNKANSNLIFKIHLANNNTLTGLFPITNYLYCVTFSFIFVHQLNAPSTTVICL